MPYKDKKRYRSYMASYMRRQRMEAQRLKAEIRNIERLRREFPSAYELIFGKKKRKK